MAQVPERRRVTVRELTEALAAVPPETPVILITECHGCAEWLDGLNYDTAVNRVELTASGGRSSFDRAIGEELRRVVPESEESSG